MGPQPFILGSVVLSLSRRFTSPSKRVADSENFWRVLNTDALVYVHRCIDWPIICQHFAVSRAKRKFLNRVAGCQRPASFRTFGVPISGISHLIWSFIEATWTPRMAYQTNNRRMDHGGSARFPWNARFKHETHLTHTHTAWRKNRFASRSEGATD